MPQTQDCICAKGQKPYCPVCVVAIAVALRYEHPDSLSPSMIRRRVPGLDGYVAAVLVEFTKRIGTRPNGVYVT